MNSVDPKLTSLQFNEYINHQDVGGISSLMATEHRFVDRAGNIIRGRETMTKCWVDFFKSFPEYRNTFNRVESQDNLVIQYGYATWKKGDDPDYAIWTARIENDLVAEWRIYEDTEDNKKKFNLI